MRNLKKIAWLVIMGVSIGFIYTSYVYGYEELASERRIKEFPESIGRVVGYSGILIKFKPELPEAAKQKVRTHYGLKPREILSIGGDNIELLDIPHFYTHPEVVNLLRLREHPAVEWIEENSILEPALTPNDPWFANWQYDKKVQMHNPQAWDITTGTSNLTLAIADTGVDCSHEDLAANCIAGWNFYDNNSNTEDVYGHGTAVAGIAAAVGNNGIGVAGHVWPCKIMPLRVSGTDGYATYSAIASAVTYAADHGARVVNNSYQTSGSATVRSAGHYLMSKGGLLTVSEGNYGNDAGYSASADLISVSAVDHSDVLYSWSSYGNDVDVAAPGCTGATTVRGNVYASACGTSASAPQTAGVLALILSVNPNLSADQAQNILFNSAIDLGDPGWDKYYGWGRVDAYQAVLLASGASPYTKHPYDPTNLSASRIWNRAI